MDPARDTVHTTQMISKYESTVQLLHNPYPFSNLTSGSRSTLNIFDDMSKSTTKEEEENPLFRFGPETEFPMMQIMRINQMFLEHPMIIATYTLLKNSILSSGIVLEQTTPFYVANQQNQFLKFVQKKYLEFLEMCLQYLVKYGIVFYTWVRHDDYVGYPVVVQIDSGLVVLFYCSNSVGQFRFRVKSTIVSQSMFTSSSSSSKAENKRPILFHISHAISSSGQLSSPLAILEQDCSFEATIRRMHICIISQSARPRVIVSKKANKEANLCNDNVEEALRLTSRDSQDTKSDYPVALAVQHIKNRANIYNTLAHLEKDNSERRRAKLLQPPLASDLDPGPPIIDRLDEDETVESLPLPKEPGTLIEIMKYHEIRIRAVFNTPLQMSLTQHERPIAVAPTSDTKNMQRNAVKTWCYHLSSIAKDIFKTIYAEKYGRYILRKAKNDLNVTTKSKPDGINTRDIETKKPQKESAVEYEKLPINGKRKTTVNKNHDNGKEEKREEEEEEQEGDKNKKIKKRKKMDSKDEKKPRKRALSNWDIDEMFDVEFRFSETVDYDDVTQTYEQGRMEYDKFVKYLSMKSNIPIESLSKKQTTPIDFKFHEELAIKVSKATGGSGGGAAGLSRKRPPMKSSTTKRKPKNDVK
jgi:hypothetical protein